MRTGSSHVLAALLLTLLAGCGPAEEPSDRGALTVYAAASLADALPKALSLWEEAGSGPVRASFGSSSGLARQIRLGARADIFISANRDWMDRLEAEDLLASGSRRNLLGNRLVLIAPVGEEILPDLRPGGALPEVFTGRLAMADPDHVPAGIYGREALTRLGFWDALQGRLASAPDVRFALAFVARGECAAGIVYATDARVSDKVRVVGEFPPESHAPIVYPTAALKAGNSELAGELLDFLGKGLAAQVFTQAGFEVLGHEGGGGN